MALFDTPRMGASGASGGGYEIDNAIRFNSADSMKLERTPSSSGDRKVWTTSFWVKRTRLDTTTYLFSNVMVSGNDGIAAIYFHSNNRINVYYDSPGGGSNNQYGDVNNREYLDTNAWYHIVWQVDASNTTHKIWVNGEEQTIGLYPPDYDYGMNASGHRMGWGVDMWDLYTYSNFYLAEVYHCDGQKYSASHFGEYSSETGAWVPKDSTDVISAVTFGTNGHYLNFSDATNTTAATLGKDYSGNGNNFTPTNFSIAAWPDKDVVTDTPTNNFCVLNYQDKNSNVSLINGNLQTDTSAMGGHYPVFASMQLTSGKWYLEFKRLVNDSCLPSIMEVEHDGGSLNTDSTVGNNTSSVNKRGYGLLTGDGRKSHNGTYSSYGSGIGQNDIAMCAFDADNGKVYWGKNDSWFNSGDPAAGSNPAFSGIDMTVAWTFAFHTYGNSNNVSVNFGQQGFSYTPPDGFTSVCAKNLADPTIVNPQDHFSVDTYDGNGGTKSVSGVGFQPNFTWVKSYKGDYATSHYMVDDVRSTSYPFKRLYSNDTSSEGNTTDRFMSFDSDGFTVKMTGGGGGFTNASTQDYVAWSWKIPTSFSSSDGSISSSGKKNTDAGVSIDLYTGTGSSGTVGHGLGVAPQAMFVKTRDSNDHWAVYNHRIGNNKIIYLNLTNSTASSSGYWNNTTPTSSVFSVGNDNKTNKSGDDYIAYCFSEVKGFSKFGKYVGGGQTGQPFIHTGFRPAWILLKCIDSSQNWVLIDDQRPGDPSYISSYKGNKEWGPLETNTSDNQSSNGQTTNLILSNGFKLLGSSNRNISGQDHVYFAFAKNPFNSSFAM